MVKPPAVVLVRHGVWLAFCPFPQCFGAEHYGNVSGHVGGLTGASFRCTACRRDTAAQWPPNVDGIARLLAMRPNVENRNWQPPETVHDLLKENVEHGLLPAADESTPLICIVGDSVTAGFSLPSVDRLALGGR